jgi:hypothetical protein
MGPKVEMDEAGVDACILLMTALGDTQYTQGIVLE